MLILIQTLQQPHITHKCNRQLQEAESNVSFGGVVVSSLASFAGGRGFDSRIQQP